MVANSTAFVARSAEILIVTKSSIAAFASHQVSCLETAISERLVLVSYEDIFIVTEVAI